MFGAKYQSKDSEHRDFYKEKKVNDILDKTESRYRFDQDEDVGADASESARLDR